MPKVSILVPIFNVEKYLEECLDSLVNQTLQDIEIICINDGSTDNSLQIVQRYAEKDSRIVILDKENSGYGDSMNQGLLMATGKYIGIVESDDWAEQDMFETLYALAEKHNVEVVKSNYFTYYTTEDKKDLSGEVIELVLPEETGRVIDPKENNNIFYKTPAIWAGLYNRKFLLDNNIFFLATPGASYQDTGFNFKVWVNAQRVFYTSNAYLHYRKDNEFSSVNNPGKVFCVQDEFKGIEKYLHENNKYDDYKVIYHNVKVNAYNWNIKRLSYNLVDEFTEGISKEYKESLEKDELLFDYYINYNNRNFVDDVINNPKILSKRKMAKDKAKISVIIPTYNSQETIKTTIDSVLNQTFTDLEIMIVDDASTDNTVKLIKEYCLYEPRITLYEHLENKGTAEARDAGIARTQAEYITFIDADDYYEKDALEKLYNSITNNNADLAVGTINIICDSSEEKYNELSHEYSINKPGVYEVDQQILSYLGKSDCAKLFKRSLQEENDIWFLAYINRDDDYFSIAYALTCHKIVFIEETIYNYVYSEKETVIRYPEQIDSLEIAFQMFNLVDNAQLFSKHSEFYGKFMVKKIRQALKDTQNKQIVLGKLKDWYEHNKPVVESNMPNLSKKITQLLLSYNPPKAENIVKRLFRKLLNK